MIHVHQVCFPLASGITAQRGQGGVGAAHLEVLAAEVTYHEAAGAQSKQVVSHPAIEAATLFAGPSIHLCLACARKAGHLDAENP